MSRKSPEVRADLNLNELYSSGVFWSLVITVIMAIVVPLAQALPGGN